MSDVLVLTVGGLSLLTALAGRWLRRTPASAPLVALALGIVLGPITGLVRLPPPEGWTGALHELTRVVLGVSLVAVGLRYPWHRIRPAVGRTLLVLAVGIPGMALLTAGLIVLVLPVGLAGALLLGAILSPTDPALVSSVVTGSAARRSVPYELRQLLSLESGANDGLALPVVLPLRRPLHLSVPDAFYLGWFGPVGVSAWFYLTLPAARSLDVTGRMLAFGTLLIAINTVVHGVTSPPLRRLYARWRSAADS